MVISTLVLLLQRLPFLKNGGGPGNHSHRDVGITPRSPSISAFSDEPSNNSHRYRWRGIDGSM
jgi:hypothetical protein